MILVFLLCDSQLGFRKGHSTKQAVINCIEKITKSVNKCKIVVDFFLDLTKAFDTEDHVILLKTNEHHGIKGPLLFLNSRFKSYLTNKIQSVLSKSINSLII